MSEISIEKLIEAAAKPEVGLNLDKAGGLFNNVDSTLKTGERVLGFVERVLADADRSRTVAATLKIYAARMNVDLNSPLPAPNPTDTIVPTSDAHRQILNGINGLSREEAIEATEVLNRWYAIKRGTAPAAGGQNAASGPNPGTPSP